MVASCWTIIDIDPKPLQTNMGLARNLYDNDFAFLNFMWYTDGSKMFKLFFTANY